MIETLTIITLSALFLIFFRPGKTPPLNNPLVIQRPGQYHVTLAPQINLAQPFIEDIAKRLGSPAALASNSDTLCFEVRDKEVTAHGKDFYLLAITQRNGMLYFQATGSTTDSPDMHRHDIKTFANTVLDIQPMNGSPDETLNAHIRTTATEAAQQRGISISVL